MSKRGRGKISDEAVIEHVLPAQRQHPHLSESGLMGELGFGKYFLADRAKSSPEIAELRAELSAIREKFWIEKGLNNLTTQGFNSSLYIWMTRNILRWSDEEKDEGQAQASSPLNLSITPELIREMLRAAKGGEPS